MVFLSCEKQVNTSFYWNNSTYCFNTEVYSSTSSSSSHDMHRYVKYLDRPPYPGQVEESCRIEQISLILRERPSIYPKTASCEEIRNELLCGFKFNWLHVSCQCDGPNNCYLDDANKIQCDNCMYVRRRMHA
ncbi:hypothetical protein I3843_01G088400 [Carya illinoinensis]|nr:hypothetical protein I3843_01G088400 [Carya illinoinensis]